MTDTKKMRQMVTLSPSAYEMLEDITVKRGLELGETLDMIVTQWHNAAWNDVLDDYDHVTEVSQIEYKLQAVASYLIAEGEITQKLSRDIATRRLLLEAKSGIPEEE